MLDAVAEHPITKLLSASATLIALPILGFLGVHMFNSIETIKDGQSTMNVHIAVIEATNATLSQRIDSNGKRIDSISDLLANRERDGDAATEHHRLNKTQQIRHLQDKIKELTQEGANINNSEVLRSIKTQLVNLLTSPE